MPDTLLSFKAAAYNGILTPNDVKPVAPNCPTGNCTWPLTPLMAVCGACVNSTFKANCDDSVCNYTMPSGSVNTFPTGEKIQGVGFQVTSSLGALFNTDDAHSL